MIGRIYKVQHLDSSLCYIGSTCNTVRDRWHTHKNQFNQWIKAKDKHRTISLFPFLEKYGLDRFQMLLIKEYELVDKQHLRVYEQLAINRTKSCCNRQAAFQVSTKLWMQQYYQKNRDLIKQRSKDRYQANKQQIIITKAAIEVECKCGTMFRKGDLVAHRQSTKHREYYEKNKQSKASVKVECECGVMVRKSNISIHRKAVKHVNLLVTLAQ